jgi:hypothetical protein
MNVRGLVVAGSLLLLSLANIGCGGGSGSANSTAITQSQALTATSDIFAALAGSSISGGYARTAVLNEEAAGIRNAHLADIPIAAPLVGIAPEAAYAATTIPSYTFNCPSGGDIVVTGSYTGTATSSSVNIVENINSCQDGGITINGDPNVDVLGTFTESGNVYTDVVTMTGGFTAGGNTCAINVTVSASVNSTTGAETGSISGSVCGISMNGSL